MLIRIESAYELTWRTILAEWRCPNVAYLCMANSKSREHSLPVSRAWQDPAARDRAAL
jgi:hypothetical protein